VLHAEGQVVCLEIVAGDHQAGLKDTALVHFPLFVPAFVPFVTVVEIRMYAGSYAEPVFQTVSCLRSQSEVFRLVEHQILHHIKLVHPEGGSIDLCLEILRRFEKQFLRYRQMFGAFDTHRRSWHAAHDGHVFIEPGIRLFGIDLLVVLCLIEIEGITLAVGEVGL